MADKGDPHDDIAAAIADGSPLDWHALELDRDEALNELRVIAQIAAVHGRGAAGGATASTCADPPPSARRPDLANAEAWGPLLLIEKVDGGSFGDVYRAWDPALDHEVALKVLRLPEQAGAASARSIVREGQLLARVRHPNVVAVHGACEVNGRPGIWMDFLHGRKLERVIVDEGPMSAEEATLVGEHVCRAVAAVHHARLLHRDIKASNVMREAGGRIVLLDFGTGCELALASTIGSVAGTPLYLAPELFDGSPPSVQSDVYSLGVLLFFLVTGTHPVKGKSLAEIRSAHQAGRRALLSDVRSDLPNWFIGVVERALAPEPEGRFNSAGAMLRDLKVTSARVEPDPIPPRPFRVAMAVGAGVAAGLLLVTTLGYVTSAAFTIHHGIGPEFMTDRPSDYLRWGGMNLVPTLVYIGIAMFVFYAAGALARLAALLPPAGRLVARAGTAWRRVVEQAGLNDVNTLCRTACAAGGIALAIILFTFRGLIRAFTSELNNAPADRLAVLNPVHFRWHGSYGLSLDMLLLLMLFVLFRVYKARNTAAPGPVIGVVALALMAMVFDAFGWRVMFMNDFRQVTYRDQTCYEIGRNEIEHLVHCPRMDHDRNHVVKVNDPNLVFTGMRKYLSEEFGSSRVSGSD